mgnify:CR=1 FL=1
MNRAAVSLPNARPRAALRPLAERLTAIIDIGSNSVRLVVYRGVVRVPLTVFNEKVMCGLAKGLAETGRMDDIRLATIAAAKAISAAIPGPVAR